MKRLAATVALIVGLAFSASPAWAQRDPEEVRRVLTESFARPDAPVALDPVAVEGDAAIVGWIQGDLAGRAFLRKVGGSWSVVACAGDALKQAATLERLGLATPQATLLTSRLAEQEAQLDPKVVARFSSFDGLLEVGPQGHPPAGHRH